MTGQATGSAATSGLDVTERAEERPTTGPGGALVARHWAPGEARTGPATAIVLVHGMVVASRSMAPLGHALARRGVQAIAPDLPGFGLSDKPARALDVNEHADAFAAWMRAAAPGSALLGNSFGAQVAAAAVARHPGLTRRLVLVAPTIDPRQRRAALRAMPFLGRPGRRRPSKRAKARWGDAQRQLLRAWQRRLGPRPSLRDLLVTEYVAAGLLRAASTYRHGIHDDITTRLPRIGVPTLVVRGANDRIVTASWARRATGLLADGRLRTVTGADHSGQFAAAEPIAELVAEFLEDGPVDPMPR